MILHSTWPAFWHCSLQAKCSTRGSSNTKVWSDPNSNWSNRWENNTSWGRRRITTLSTSSGYELPFCIFKLGYFTNYISEPKIILKLHFLFLLDLLAFDLYSFKKDSEWPLRCVIIYSFHLSHHSHNYWIKFVEAIFIEFLEEQIYFVCKKVHDPLHSDESDRNVLMAIWWFCDVRSEDFHLVDTFWKIWY